MSRWAIRLPAVARRSPAMTTPSGYRTATIVVPCGTAAPSPSRPGNRSGEAAATNSVNEDEPGIVAYRRMPCTGSVPARWKFTLRPYRRAAVPAAGWSGEGGLVLWARFVLAADADAEPEIRQRTDRQAR